MIFVTSVPDRRLVLYYQNLPVGVDRPVVSMLAGVLDMADLT